MKKLLVLSAAIATLFAGRVYADDVTDPRYFTIDESSVMIEKLPAGPEAAALPAQTKGTIDFGQVNQVIGTLDNIVNLVDKIWTIIEKNQPVVNITTNYANAVPYGMSHWSQLQGWSKPGTAKYSFAMKNGFGSQVVKVTYQVHYTYGGNYQGKGKFLTGVTVEPLNVETAWGYKVSLTSEVPDSTIANVGTSDDPIAAMQVQLRWTVHTAIKDISSKAIYYVRGDGQMSEIGSPFEKAAEAKTKARVEAASGTISGSTFD